MKSDIEMRPERSVTADRPRLTTRFTPGPDRPDLPSQELHLWRAQLDRVPTSTLALLDSSERRRAARIQPALRRRRWGAGRAALRIVLGRYTETPPGLLRLSADPNGRVATDPGAGPAFSLAHSGGVALFAVCAASPPGVDIELAGRGRRLLGPSIAARLLGDEQAARLSLLDTDSAADRLLQAWVRREALLKCAHERPWIADLLLPGGAVGALARAEAPAEIRCWELELENPPAGAIDSLASCRDRSATVCRVQRS